MICETCQGTGRPPSSESRVAICETCGGKGYTDDPQPVQQAPVGDTGLETTKAPHEIKDAMGHSDDPLDSDGDH